MADTIRTMAELQSIFQDGQTQGISAQDCRDLIVSTIGQTGWESAQDTLYSDGSPQSLTSGVDTIIQNNGATRQSQELPFGITSLWDGTNFNVPITVPGSALLVTYEGIFRRASGTGEWELDMWLDIGLPGPVKLYPRTYAQESDGSDKYVTWTFGVYCLDTWVANGGTIYANTQVDAEVYNSRVVVHHLHRGRGVYP